MNRYRYLRFCHLIDGNNSKQTNKYRNRFESSTTVPRLRLYPTHPQNCPNAITLDALLEYVWTRKRLREMWLYMIHSLKMYVLTVDDDAMDYFQSATLR